MTVNLEMTVVDADGVVISRSAQSYFQMDEKHVVAVECTVADALVGMGLAKLAVKDPGAADAISRGRGAGAEAPAAPGKK